MSAAVHTLAPMSVPHPWRVLRALADVELRWHDGGPRGLTRHSDRVISIRRDQTWEERRCAVLHECLHVIRGPVPRGLSAKEEESVRRETARWLIPDIRTVGEALAWAHTISEAAEELGVATPVLRYRIEHASPMEVAWLRHRLRADDAVDGELGDPGDSGPEGV